MSKYAYRMPAIAVEGRFVDMVFKGRKCWELRKRMLPQLRPVLVVREDMGWRRPCAIAGFCGCVADIPESILGDLVAFAGKKAGRAGVDQKWVDAWARGAQTVYANRYWKIMAYEPECTVVGLDVPALRSVTLETDDVGRLNKDLVAMRAICDEGIDVDWLARFGEPRHTKGKGGAR